MTQYNRTQDAETEWVQGSMYPLAWLSHVSPPYRAKAREAYKGNVFICGCTYTLFPVTTLAISPKKNVREGKHVLACPATHQQRQFDCQTCFGMPRHAPAKAIRLSKQMLILFSYFPERPALTGQD